MYTAAQFKNTRREIRTLRQENARLQRFHQFQKHKADTLEEENHRLKQGREKNKQEKEKLQEEVERIKREGDAYKGMVFKSKTEYSCPQEHTSGKKLGRQIGHTGISHKTPGVIDQYVHVYATTCPTC